AVKSQYSKREIRGIAACCRAASSECLPMISVKQALEKLDASDMDDLVPGFGSIAKSALLVGAGVFALFAVLHLTTLPQDLRWTMFASASITALCLAGFYAGLQRGLLPRGAARFAMSA